MEIKKNDFILLKDENHKYCLVGMHTRLLGEIELLPISDNFSVASEDLNHEWGYVHGHFNIEVDPYQDANLSAYRFRDIDNIAKFCNWNTEALQDYLNAYASLTNVVVNLNDDRVTNESRLTILKA